MTTKEGLLSRNEYEGDIDGIPLLKQVVYEDFYGKKDAPPKISLRKIYDITAIVPGAPDLSVFDVQQFFSTPLGKTIQWSYFRILCVALGIVFVFLAIYLKYLKTDP